MKTFSTITEAFDFFLLEIFPTLPASVKKGKINNARIDYEYKKKISEARMEEILKSQGFKIETVVIYKP